MSLHENKINWCLEKARKEMEENGIHKGLIKIKPERRLIEDHIKKAEHNLKAMSDFKRIGYSDWSASAAFYSIYHCLLAIITKFGYESRNQECTFSLIYDLIEKNQLNLDKKVLEEVHSLKIGEKFEFPTIVEIREIEQYGVKLSLDDQIFDRLLRIAKEVLDKAKEILAE